MLPVFADYRFRARNCFGLHLLYSMSILIPSVIDNDFFFFLDTVCVIRRKGVKLFTLQNGGSVCVCVCVCEGGGGVARKLILILSHYK